MYQNMSTLSASAGWARKGIAICFLSLFGLGIVYGVGFFHSHLMHNAAHDVRHSFGFPCH